MIYRGCLHDETRYPQPDEFRPERFLNDDGSLNKDAAEEVKNIAFGFGRRHVISFENDNLYSRSSRICPGRHLAENAFWSVVATLLSLYDLSPGLDSEGNRCEVTLQPDASFITKYVIICAVGLTGTDKIF